VTQHSSSRDKRKVVTLKAIFSPLVRKKEFPENNSFLRFSISDSQSNELVTDFLDRN
jgi:hypothetical protein